MTHDRLIRSGLRFGRRGPCLAAGLVSLIGVWSLAAPLAQAERPPRPNIVLVMTDDQGMGDLSCLGNPVLKTPHLDALYEQSTRWTNFHVSPTCAPTRSAIMSGRHEFRNGVTHTILERERMALATTTLPQLLQNAGYQTGLFGKWHLGDEDAYQPDRRGFDEVFLHGGGGVGQSYPGSCADFPPNQTGEKYFDIVARHNDTIVQTEGFCTDVFFQAALGWIHAARTKDQPFFAYLATNAPHAPMLAPEASKRRFRDMGYDEEIAARYGMIENIDDNIGVLMQKLREWGLEENTLLIFMTDNGQSNLFGTKDGKRVRMYTAGFRTGKGTPYEGGSHVPAFWRWKGVLGEGVDRPHLTAHLDLLPTFCDLAGATIDESVPPREGRSLVPLFDNPDASWPDRTLITHVGRWDKGTDPSTARYRNFAVRTSRWRLVNQTELYDMQADPFETTNVAGDHPDVVQDLMGRFDRWWEETLPYLVNEDVPLSPTQPFVERYNQQQAERGIPAWTRPAF